MESGVDSPIDQLSVPKLLSADESVGAREGDALVRICTLRWHGQWQRE